MEEQGRKCPETTRQWVEVGTILCSVGCSGHHRTELTNRMINSFDRKLDDKNRLILPVGLRQEFPSGEAILTKGFDNTLALYAKEYWEAVVEPALEGDFTDEASFILNRRLNSDQLSVQVDAKRGRITIDQRFLDASKITGSLTAFRIRTKTDSNGRKWSYWALAAKK